MQTSICWGKTTLTIKFRLPRSRKWWRIFYHNIDNARIYTNNVSVAEQITISESLCENHWELHFCFSSRHLILAYEAGQSQMPLHQIKFAKWLWLGQWFRLFEKSIEKFSYFNSYINFISIKMRNKYKWWTLKSLCRNWIYYSAPNRWTMDGSLSPHPLPLTDYDTSDELKFKFLFLGKPSIASDMCPSTCFYFSMWYVLPAYMPGKYIIIAGLSIWLATADRVFSSIKLQLRELCINA